MMKTVDAFQVVSNYRKDAVVIPCQEGRNPWQDVTTNEELDIPFAGCMGKGSSLGLGIALARPDRKVMVLDGDGSLLMNLGSLVTIAGMAPKNLCHFVVENGIYAGTGGQPIPNMGKLSFADLAKAAGYVEAYEFDDLEEFAVQAEEIINAEGPIFVCLKVEPEPETRPMALRLQGGWRRIQDGVETVRAILARS